MKRIIILSFLLIAFMVLSLTIRSQVEAHGSHNVWKVTNTGEWGDCTPDNEFDSCEGGAGTQTRTITETCESTSGHGEDECAIRKVCPEGYTPGLSNKCWKYYNHSWHSKEYIYVPETREREETQACKIPGNEEFCKPDPTPTPQPTPEPEQPDTTDHNKAGEAPQCPDGTTTQPADNAHVLRYGGSADVNFFIKEGDSANIYWKLVDANEWQNALADVRPNSDGYVSVTINDLVPSLGYTFGIQTKYGCGGGAITSVIVDGPQTQLFRVNYYVW